MARSTKGTIVITLDTFRKLSKPWLRQRIAEVKADSHRIWTEQLTLTLADMGIEPDSEVGRFIFESYDPVWSTQEELRAALSVEAIFDFLTIFTGDDDDK